MKYLITLLLFTTSLSCFALPAQQIHHIIVFGDSLSDAGYADLTPRPKGKMATYSNGPVWAQYLSQNLTHMIIAANNQNPIIHGKTAFASGMLHGFDYAAGGATTYGKGISFSPKNYQPPSLVQQVTAYLQYRKPTNSTVYIIWAGANDLFRVYWQHRHSRWDMFWAFFPAINKADDTIATQVKRLHTAGARHIVVIAIPNIGLTPLLNKHWMAQKMYSYIVGKMNYKLKTKLHTLPYPVLFVSINKIFKNILHEDGKSFKLASKHFKFTNTTEPACLPMAKRRMIAIYCHYPKNANDYFFADKIHPTTTGHKILAADLAQQILTKLQ